MTAPKGSWLSLPGGLRSGSGASPAPTLDDLMEQVSALVAHQEQERVQRRQQLAQLVEESASSSSATSIILPVAVQGLFRVCYVVAYSDAAATLQLKGDNNTARLTLAIPAKTLVSLPLGDGRSGGVFLTPQDVRSLTMTGGSPTAGPMTLILTGVEMPTQQRW